MKHYVLVFAALVAACGPSSKSTTATTTPTEPAQVVGPPTVAWKDMTHEQQATFMKEVVVPKFKPMFQQFDGKVFAEFNCKTCHAEAVIKDKSFKMPNPDIFVLPEVPDDFKKLAADKPEWMKFMPKVEEEMAKTLGLPPYNPAAPDPGQFGCFGCHTHKPGGGDK